MLLKYPYFYLKCTVHSLVCAKLCWLSKSHHFWTELSRQWVWLRACSGVLYILPCVQGPKLVEMTPQRCFTGRTHWCLPRLFACTPCHRWERRGQLCHLWPLTPHVPMLLYSDLFIYLNENQQKISITLPMYKQLQYCGRYSINMNVLFALSIPMLFHAFLAHSDPGMTLWLHWVQRIELSSAVSSRIPGVTLKRLWGDRNQSLFLT